MKKFLLGTVYGALIASAISGALAITGKAPPANGGFRLMDSAYVLGIAQGVNFTFINGITATGTTQATATQLIPGFAIVNIDTVAASTGVALPPCIAGTVIDIYNNGLNTLTIYPSIANNPITGIQDTINAITSITLASHVAISPACGKNGGWGAS